MEENQLSVKLEVFEGPLELLLHLLKKNKVSIYDIPIVKITAQYMEYLDAYQKFDMEISSEFLLLAAELLFIKSKMLLPRHEEEEEDDPRKDLVARLEEYQKIKKAAEFLKEQEFSTYYNFFKKPDIIEKRAPDYSTQSFDLNRLLEAFSVILDRTERKAPPPKTSFSGIVGHEKVSVTSRAEYIKNRLTREKKVSFTALFENITTRPALVATFLALLEMMKLEIVFADTSGEEIIITKLKDGDITNEF